ncbi:MAG: branched-chain amino acid ABC transporter permease, partial [Desulfuromusa sp.]|nr:branched-chain amino acid ABC transporter permease [Desulfuromusa sp.]
TVIIVTTGIWYVLDNLSLLLFGAEYRVVKTSVTGKVFEFYDMYFLVPKIIGAGITILCGIYLYWFLKHSKMGKAIRATSLDREAASLMGIKQSKIYNIAFGMGCACCGLAACVLVPFYYVYPTVGVPFDIKAFIIVVLGGLGSIPGAIIGGIIVGIIENVGAQFMASTWTELLLYGVFIFVLLVKPSGLFGMKQDF